MLVSEILAKELKKNGVKDIFMLTGYGAMYLNDAIEKQKINYFAARNEAAAPMMAEAYAKATGGLGAGSVTAGPGAEELSTTYSANSTASNATTSTNVYPHESRLDVVLPEEANAAAASNAVSYTRVHWLG